MNTKYDILITVYNKEKYIRRCLESAINQTYKKFNIIIVDDGSTDSTENIIKEYQRKYNNIYYYYKENSGVADTRNYAISKVTSPFFTFLDADDYFDLNLLKKLDPFVEKDIDITSFSCYYDLYPMRKVDFFGYSGEDALFELNKPETLVLYDVPWGYIYNTKFFKENNFQYLSGTEHEDSSLTPIVIAKAKKVNSLNFPLYHYVNNTDSITHNVETEKKRIVDKIRHLKSLIQFYYNYDFKDKYHLYILRDNVIYDILRMGNDISSKNFKYYLQKLKDEKVYEMIQNNCKLHIIYRWILKHIPIVPVIFYLGFIYSNAYKDLNINLKQFLIAMRRDGHDKYIEFSKSNLTFFKFRMKRLLLFVRCTLKNFYLLFLPHKYIKLDYLEMPITTICNLKCKKCSNFIPLYSNNKNFFDTKTLLNQVNDLLKCIDCIDTFGILGGEPFLHPNLNLILENLVSQKKIKKIMVVTNGTIFPTDEKLIKILKNNKIRVKISDYGINSNITKKLVELLRKENIHTKFFNYKNKRFWLDYGDLKNQHKTVNELTKQYSMCTSERKCLSFLKGKLYICPRSSHGMDLNIIKDVPEEYIDFTNNKISNNFKRKKILELLYKKKYFTACNYCNIGTEKAVVIPAAEQDN